ncbi:MAG: 3'-5' exonuclease, partial [Myxococcota bacterium]
EGAGVVKLERNYRSTQPILSSATAVVSQNPGRKEKAMFTEKPGGAPLRCYAAYDDRDEAQWVVREILSANRNEHRSYGEIAILYRTNNQSRSFEEEFLKYDVPYAVIGGVRFYERAEVKDALAYLRLILNPKDDQALRRILNRPARGIGKKTLERGEAVARQEEVPLLEGLRGLVESGSGGRTTARVKAFLELMEGLAEDVPGKIVDEALADVLERSGMLTALRSEATPEAEVRLENLTELVASAEDFHENNAEILADEDRTELELYLDQVALISDVDSYEPRSDRVSLMTAHSAKGLEFACVYMVGMEEGIFPHANSSRDEEGLEEERRLCYVGMTRAMEVLTLTHAHQRRRWGERAMQSPSRFLSELPEELVEMQGSAEAPEVRGFPGSGRVGSGPSLDYSYSQEVDADGETAPGRRVRHAVFGVGTILSSSGSDLDMKLKIRFDRAGVKTVMVRYANLEPV